MGATSGSDDPRSVILVVEDDPNDEYLTLRALRKLRLASEILVARDGVEAVELLFSRCGREGQPAAPLPRLVLLDLKLPKMSGIDVLRTVRTDARFSQLPIVVFTSSSQALDIAAAYQHGANSYVPKPVNHESFMQAVSTVGSYWMTANVVSG